MAYYRTTGSELSEQIAVVSYCEWNRIPIVHITNEGKRSVVQGQQLKRAGLKKGFPDLFVPVPTKDKHGLFIEMKVGYNKASEHQKYWLKLLNNQGYLAKLCYGADEAIGTIQEYLKDEKAYKVDAFDEMMGNIEGLS